jgi:hypothetical protein
MKHHIGLDSHGSSCTLGVIGPSGKRLGSCVVKRAPQSDRRHLFRRPHDFRVGRDGLEAWRSRCKP